MQALGVIAQAIEDMRRERCYNEIVKKALEKEWTSGMCYLFVAVTREGRRP
jgi:hypothetical protein